MSDERPETEYEQREEREAWEAQQDSCIFHADRPALLYGPKLCAECRDKMDEAAGR